MKVLRFMGNTLMIGGCILVIVATGEPEPDTPYVTILAIAVGGFAGIFGGHRLRVRAGGKPIFQP